MVLTDRNHGAMRKRDGVGTNMVIEAFEYHQKGSNMESCIEPLHTTKQVKISIQKEQQRIKELELEVESLKSNNMINRSVETRGQESSKKPKLEVDTELLFKLKREIRLRKFSLQVARAVFAQFMLAEDDDDDETTIDLSDVIHLARETCFLETDSDVSECQLKEMIESMLEVLGLYVKQADNWNFQIGFLMNQEIEV